MEFTLLLAIQLAAAVLALYASRFVKRYFDSYRIYQKIKHYPGMSGSHKSLTDGGSHKCCDMPIHLIVCSAWKQCPSSPEQTLLHSRTGPA